MFPMTLTIHNQEQFDLIANALRDKITALSANTSTVSSASQSTTASTNSAGAEKKPKTKAEPEKKPDAASQSTGGTSASGASAAPSDTGASTGTLNYETEVKPLVLKLVGKIGRDNAIAFLKENYQVEKAHEVPADKWPGLVESINKKLAA